MTEERDVWTEDTVAHVERPDSTNIARLYYHQRLQTLRVDFRNGGSYTYHPCAFETFEAIATAESAGKAFSHHVRKAPPDTYTVTKLEPRVLAGPDTITDDDEV